MSHNAKTDAYPRSYLLFGGRQQPPRGGLADLVEAFCSEETARHAFRQLRLQKQPRWAWAQLALVDGEDGVQPLCWFGIGAAPERMHTTIPRRRTATPRQRGFKLRAIKMLAPVEPSSAS